MNVPQNRKTHLIIVGKDAAICQMYENSKKSFANLAFAKEIHVQQDKTGIGEDAVSVVVSMQLFICLWKTLLTRKKNLRD